MIPQFSNLVDASLEIDSLSRRVFELETKFLDLLNLIVDKKGPPPYSEPESGGQQKRKQPAEWRLKEPLEKVRKIKLDSHTTPMDY